MWPHVGLEITVPAACPPLFLTSPIEDHSHSTSGPQFPRPGQEGDKLSRGADLGNWQLAHEANDLDGLDGLDGLDD